MRKAFALMLAILLCCCGSVTTFAMAQYRTAEDLYEDWQDALPDYICGVWYADGEIKSLTFGIQNNEAGNAGMQHMRSLVEDDSSIRFVYQEFSRNYLLQIQKEIDDRYFEEDLGLVSTGLDDRNNCIVIEIQQSQKDHADTKRMVEEITQKYGKAVNISYTNARYELTIGEDQSPYTHLVPFNQPSFLPIVLISVFLISIVILMVLRRKIFLLRTNNGITVSQTSTLSSKELKAMIKKSGHVIQADFDEQVMNRINAYAKENGVTAARRKRRIPVWGRRAAATACLCVLIALGFFGIQSILPSTPPKEGTQYDTPFYYITVEDGQYKLIPKVTLSPPKIPSNFGVSMGYIYPRFASIEEMRQAIITGAFTERELYDLFHSSQSADGGIKICDPEHLYAFTFPDEFSTRMITWYGKRYDCSLTGKTASGDMKCYDEESYTEDINKEYKYFLSDPYVTITEQRKTLNRFSTEYYGYTNDTKLKYVCYEISKGNKKMYIQEKYILESGSGLAKVSSNVPSSIAFWGTENSGYFKGHVYGLTERPSVEWLLEFGLTPYVMSAE